MAYRVAIASSDGKYVNQHFGRATQFLIFEVAQDAYHFVERRPNQPSCNWEQPDENQHESTIALLKDCRAVVVSRIGPAAAEKLKLAGVEPLIIPDFIDAVLQGLVNQE